MIAKFTTEYSNNICHMLLTNGKVIAKESKINQKQFLKERTFEKKNNAAMEFRSKVRDESNPEEKRKNMENLLQNFQTTVKMIEEIKVEVEVKAETEIQKVVSKIHLPHMRQKTVQVKNDLHLTKYGSIQNICIREDKDFSFR